MNIFPFCTLSGISIFVSNTVFWAYFAGFSILVIGLLTYGKEAWRAHGTEKILNLSPILFAIPMAVFASQHFTETKAVSTLVPRWLPWHIFWTYFVGTAVVAASLSIVAKRQGRLAGILLAILLILFELCLHIPFIMAHPKNVIGWAIALRDLAFSGGALAFAATQTEDRKTGDSNYLAILARFFISAPAIFFGVEHFLHPQFMPGVDFDRSMPAWVPAPIFWSYFAGAVFLIAGVSLFASWKARFAAMCLGFMGLLLTLFVYLPILVAKPLDLDNGLNFLVSTLAFSGAALLLAKAIPISAPASS